MLFQCWPTVFEVGPTLKQHWLIVSCLLDYQVKGYSGIIPLTLSPYFDTDASRICCSLNLKKIKSLFSPEYKMSRKL